MANRNYISNVVFVFLFLLSIAVICLGVFKNEGKADTIVEMQEDSIPSFYSKSPQNGLYEAMEFYNIHHQDIVFAQAVLETGNFSSKLCVDHNNLFGLYDSKHGRYYRFNHWTESVEAYQKWIQKRYKPPHDYYHFLDRIGYATDRNYTSKLKRIVIRLEHDKRRDIARDTVVGFKESPVGVSNWSREEQDSNRTS